MRLLFDEGIALELYLRNVLSNFSTKERTKTSYHLSLLIKFLQTAFKNELRSKTKSIHTWRA